MRLLVTRPEPENARTAAALRRRGHDVVLAPLLSVETVTAEIGDGPFAGVILTSANGARALPRQARAAALCALPVFAVGERTAEAARAAGCADVAVAAGDVQSLVALIAAQARPGAAPLLYLAGQDRAGDVEGALAAHGIAVRLAVVYRARAADALPPKAVAALRDGTLDGVLHFSARSAAAYLDGARGAGLLGPALAPVHFCLSAQVAAPLMAAGAPDVRIASRPDEDALALLLG